jgi:hypothetical protein
LHAAILDAEQERDTSNLNQAIRGQISSPPNQMSVGIPSIMKGPLKAGTQGVFCNRGRVMASHIESPISYGLLGGLFREFNLVENLNLPLAIHFC